MRSVKIISIIAFLAVACLATVMVIRKNNTKTNLKTDLKFIYETIVENHPGIYNELDQKFKENLEHNYKIAQESILKTSDINEQQKIITTFAKNFNDNHLCVGWKDDIKKYRQKKNLGLFKITNLNDQVSWVTLPTFEPNEEQKKDYEKVLEQISSLRHKKAIIFDIRGNSGGNSDYGTDIIKNLFGQNYTEHKIKIAKKNEFVDWRASKGNLAYIKSNHDDEEEQKKGFQESLDQNKPYWRDNRDFYCDNNNFENNSSGCKKQNTSPLSHDVTARIILAIDARNASAALNFIDELKEMAPKITLIGQKTGSDRLYMDIAKVDLPSGEGIFVYPMKVYRNRIRKDNEPYFPDIEYDTSDTEKLQKYILKIVD